MSNSLCNRSCVDSKVGSLVPLSVMRACLNVMVAAVALLTPPPAVQSNTYIR